MTGFFDWLVNNWMLLIIPIAIFAFSLIALLWLRWLAFQRLERWLTKSKLTVEIQVLRALRWPSVIWGLIISIYLGVVVSQLPSTSKSLVGKGLWTLLLISLTLALISVLGKLLEIYSSKLQLSQRGTAITRNVVRIVILIIAILIALEIWGVPTSPIILFIAIAALAGALALRDVAPDLFAGFQLSTTHEIKVGDYIKLQTGEEGYVTEVNWRNTRVKAADDSLAIIPNRRLLQTTVVVYARQMKKAKEPFRFNSHLLLTELTGLKARSLKELAETLKNATDPVIYFHTHHFLEEHFYLTPNRPMTLLYG